ncbi:MAG: AraC family transcriptional regulator [Opitutales bacterium]
MIIEGEGEYWCADHRCAVGPGFIVSFAPGNPHGLRSSQENSFAFYRITFVGTYTAGLFREVFAQQSKTGLLSESERVAELYARMLREAVESRPYHEDLLIQYVPVLLTTIRQGMQARGLPTRAQELWLKAKATMDAEFIEGISVADVAANCHCSTEHLSRSCRKLNVPTPSEYLIKLRMNHAAQLLRLKQDKLAVVAEQCGYANEYAFSKAFRRYFGRSPGAWRIDN